MRGVRALLALAAALLPAQELNFGISLPPRSFVRPPAVESLRLPNGLRVLLSEDHELPLVQGILLVRAGSAFDPPGMAGLSQMTAQTMAAGGGRDSEGEAFRRALAELGAALQADIRSTDTAFTFQVPSEGLPAMLDLFGRMILHPAFPIESIESVRGSLAQAVGQRNASQETVSMRAARRYQFGPDSPYGRLIEYDHLDSIGREQMQQFHGRFYFPANALLALRGDFASAGLRQSPERILGSWPASPEAFPESPALGNAPETAVYLSPVPVAERSLFVISQRGGRYLDEDHAPMLVAASLLAGRILGSEDRRRGWDLRLSGSWTAGMSPDGLFLLSGSVRAGSTTAAIGFVIDELRAFPSRSFSQQEVDAARTQLLRSLAASLSSPAAVFQEVAAASFYGLPADFLTRFQRNLAALTPAEVARAVRRNIRPGHVIISVAGDPVAFLDPLDRLGLPVHTVDLTIPPPKPLEARTDPDSLEQGRRLLSRLQQALGGADPLAAVKDYQAVSSGLVVTQTGTTDVRITDSWIAEATFRQDQVYALQQLTFFYNGKIGWIGMTGRLAAMPAFVVDQMQGQVFRLLVRLALSDRVPDRIVSYMGSNIVLIQDPAGETVRVYIDEKTNLPTRLSYRQQQAAGAFVSVDDYLDDWRDAGGLRFPGKTFTRVGGRPYSQFTVDEIRVNSGLKLEDLERKP